MSPETPCANDAPDWHRIVTAALAEDRIALAMQPVMQAQAANRVAFHEGLLRLIGADGSPISAAAFIGAVEGTPLIRALDRAALRLGLRALAEAPDLRLSINLSARSVGDPGWGWTMQDALARDATLAERLIVEITESAVCDAPDMLARFVSHWQAAGIAFALDDFGAGYTSFRHLREIRFDIIKIDGRFSRNVDRDPDNQALMRAIAGLARHFEALTVAEAVETEAEAAWLARNGLDALQGYRFGRPALPDARQTSRVA